MVTETASNQSPLASLYRQRRTSPLAATRSKRNSPLSYTSRDSGSPIRTPLGSALDNLDDSDDEGKAPQLSALARMLLDEFPEPGATPESGAEDHKERSSEGKRQSPLSRYAASRKRITWSQSPDSEERPTNSGSYGTAQKYTSREGSPERPTGHEVVTPAVSRYNRRVFTGTYTKGESGLSGDTPGPYEEAENRYTAGGYASIIRPGPHTGTAGFPPSTTASAMRWKRSGRGMLGGAPRRGPRRESDQTQEERRDDIGERNSSSPEEVHERGLDDRIVSHSRPSSKETSPREEQGGIVEQQPISTISRRSRRASPESLSDNLSDIKMNIYSSVTHDTGGGGGGGGSPSSRNRSTSPQSIESGKPSLFSAAAAAPQAASKPDKENMPPPAFRRLNMATPQYKLLDTADEKPPVSQAPMPPPKTDYDRPLATSPAPEKRALATKTSNTPLRPAPPPPKMSMLQAVTATAGAATTQKRNRTTVFINGRPYRRLDAIGKGGSCKVYKVMAENYKMFAMKKVTFHDQDGEAAIRGYKGEIDLLKRLAGEERVIRLFDFELNEEKQNLTMLMECGETDFANILILRNGNEESQLDVSFVRYYWSEMLQCVDVVHKYNVIHSDLKPANFLLVRGKLKLIDFGIANAVADDTVNVHRESQVGTLNYMSPEAIVDINATSGKPMQSIGQPRLMKLGAPSDVWSLGCILYQMTYGKTPFYHLTSMYQKIAAIPDPDHAISYPSTGIGGVTVPRSLINTIHGCLERDKDKRPTIMQLLSLEDPFLNPERAKQGLVDISEDMLRLLLENAVDQSERAGKPDKGTLAVWAKDVYDKLEKRMEGQRPGYR